MQLNLGGVVDMTVISLSAKDLLLNSSTSKGTQLKWVKNNLFIKADMLGYESVAEAVVSDFLKYIEDIDFVDYSLCKIVEDNSKSYYGCYSKSFLSPNEECISFYKLLKTYYGSGKILEEKLKGYQGKEKCLLILSIVQSITGLDLSTYVDNILKLDAITLNEDRHLNNLCMIRGISGWRVCPIFDNGLSLLSDLNAYPYGNPVRLLCSRVKAKPFSTDFSKQAKYISNRPLIIDFKRYEQDLRNKTVDFKNKDFMRATSVLLGRCRKLEGILWVQKK